MKRYITSSLLTLLSSTIAYAATDTISSIAIKGNSTIPTDALELNLAANGIVTGAPLNQEGLNKFRERVLEHYRYFRRSEAKVNTVLTYLPDNQVKVELHIQENVHQYNHQQALPYDEDIYKDDPQYSDAETEAPIIDDEGPEGVLSLGVGYGNKGTILRASLIKHRFLDGSGSLRLAARRDKYETNASISYSLPDLFKPDSQLDTELFYDTFNNDSSKTIAPYHRRSYGIRSLLRLPITEESTFSTGLRFTRNHLKNIQPEYSRALYLASVDKTQWKFNNNDFDLLLGWEHKSLNKKFLPTQGTSLRIDGQVSLPGSDNRYYKVNLNAVGFLPLNEKKSWVLSAKTSLGYAEGINNKQVPFYQNYAVGGMDTLRGFEYGAVGPKAIYANTALTGVNTAAANYTHISRHTVGGNAFAAASVALIVPSFFVPKDYRSSFQTSLFIDAANAWNTKAEFRHPLLPDNHRASRFRVSGGIAIQWKFPLGVLSASYALPIKKYPGDRLQAFQLNLSGSF